MYRGYVRLWRRSLDAGWLKNHKLWVFWSWCLLKASHKECDVFVGFQKVHLLPGQFIFGRAKAARTLTMTEREVRTCLTTLKTTNNVTVKATSKFSIVSIINWDTYQQINETNDQQTDQQKANERPTNDQQTTTNKNEKNEKNNIRECGVIFFTPPTLQQVQEYCRQRSNQINSQTFIDFYTSKNWMIGKNKMKDWKAAVRTWEQKERSENRGTYRQYSKQNDRPLDAGTAEDAERVAAEWNKAQAAANDNTQRNAVGDHE